MACGDLVPQDSRLPDVAYLRRMQASDVRDNAFDFKINNTGMFKLSGSLFEKNSLGKAVLLEAMASVQRPTNPLLGLRHNLPGLA